MHTYTRSRVDLDMYYIKIIMRTYLKLYRCTPVQYIPVHCTGAYRYVYTCILVYKYTGRTLYRDIP